MTFFMDDTGAEVGLEDPIKCSWCESVQPLGQLIYEKKLREEEEESWIFVCGKIGCGSPFVGPETDPTAPKY